VVVAAFRTLFPLVDRSPSALGHYAIFGSQVLGKQPVLVSTCAE
jgi:hypothetical protein